MKTMVLPAKCKKIALMLCDIGWLTAMVAC